MKNSFARRWLAVLLALTLALSLIPAAYAITPTVQISPNPVELEINGTQQLSVSLSDNLQAQAVTWSSDNSGVADVDANGLVTAKAEGKATITAECQYEDTGSGNTSTVSGTREVNVKPAAPTIEITLSDSSVTLQEKEEKTLTATVKKNGTVDNTASVTWKSDNVAVATVAGGKITAVAKGSATITASHGGEEASCSVTVNAAPPVNATITCTTNSVTLEKGRSSDIQVRTTPENAEVKWKFRAYDESGNPLDSTTSDVVSLNAKGNTCTVTGLKPGRVDLIAYVNEGTGVDEWVKIEVQVSGIYIDMDSIEGVENGVIKVKENERKALPIPKLYGVAASGSYKYESNDSYIASVVGTEVVGYQIGETRIVVSSTKGNYKEYIPIQVIADPTTTIEAGTIGSGDTLPFGSSFMERKFDEQLGGKVVSVTGLKVSSTDCGTLYYNYHAEAEPGPGVGGVETYYRNPGPGQMDLADVTFVPKGTFIGGLVEINYTAVTEDRETYACKIVLTVRPDSGSSAGISLLTPYNTAVKFSGTEFGRVCREKISAQLNYVSFSLPPVRQGTLYTNYVNENNYGSIVTMRDRYSQKDLDNVWFVPAPGYEGDVTIYYTGRGVGASGASYSGQVKVTVGREGGVDIGGLAYDVSKGGVARFDDTDFNNYCQDVLDSRQTLSFIRFDSLPSADQGVLYYDYRSTSSTGSRAVAGTSYYYGTRTPRIDRLAFVPSEGFTGTIKLPFTGQTADGTHFAGNVEINVRGGSGSGDITYQCKPGKTVYFNDTHFNRLCRELTNSALSYIEFQGLPNSSDGTLYYGSRAASTGTRYRNGSSAPRIDNLSFRASSRFSGAVDIPFVGTAASGETFYGVVTIDSESTGNSDDYIHYYTDSKTAAVFKQDDFDDLSQWLTERNVSTVKFEIPATSQGDLYQNYRSSSSKGSRITSRNTTISGSSLDRVAFIPASGFTGVVDIDFTAKATNGDEFSGTVEVEVERPSADVTVRYSTRVSPVNFHSGDFGRSGYTLRSVKFGSMPASSAGHLYYRYTSPTQYERQASTGSTYNVSGSSLISDLTFIPKAGYTGTVTLPYTGTNSNGSTFEGEVIITITPAYSSAYFNDMSGYNDQQRAAVDYLYESGITTGVGGGRYGPTSSITRGDFALMVYKAFGLSTASSSGRFSDVPSSAYYAQAVNALASLGIVSGVGGGRFGPNNRVTREDALIMVRQAMRAVGWSASDGYSSTLSAYSDGNTVSEYAKGAVSFALQMGYLPVSNGRVAPREQLTRVDMAQILHRVLTT